MNSLLIEKVGERDGRALWRVARTFRYFSEHLRPWLGDDTLFIPRGFLTDLASVPRPILAIVGETAQEASLPHDWLYQMHNMFQDREERGLPRKIADYVFHEAMGVYGPTDWRRPLMFHGVRVGGSKAWNTSPNRVAALNPKMNMYA